MRNRALAALLYLGDFRIVEVLPLKKENFELMPSYVWVKDVAVGKKKAGKVEYREAKLPLEGERRPFTELVLQYVATLEVGQRLFPWSLEAEIQSRRIQAEGRILQDSVEHSDSRHKTCVAGN